MLRALRLRLSLLYLVSSLGLVTLLGGATYGILALYFQNSTDLALEYKMASEFRARGLPLSSALEAAEESWAAQSGGPLAGSLPTASGYPLEEEGGEDLSSTPSDQGEAEDLYDGNLAPVFVIPAAGSAAVNGMPRVDAPAALAGALQEGSDLRTVRLEDGTRLRLLTYRVGEDGVLQVARLLSDQDRLLARYLTGLLVLGGAASLLLAVASWSLAGRSIKPAQLAWDQQQSFISNASHELRTPLTLLRAGAEYALRSPSPAEREKSLQDIVAECDYMNRLVEDLLLLSRLDARRLVLQDELVSLPALLGETCRQVEKLAHARGVDLRLESAEGQVRGDRVRLRQVLLIVLDNALRFSPAGGSIRLDARISTREAVIQIADQGVGISPEHLAHIFERFYQVPGQPGEERGNGLGLSIAKALVEAQHGRITVSSQPGEGTTVQVRLPAA